MNIINGTIKTGSVKFRQDAEGPTKGSFPIFFVSRPFPVEVPIATDHHHER